MPVPNVPRPAKSVSHGRWISSRGRSTSTRVSMRTPRSAAVNRRLTRQVAAPSPASGTVATISNPSASTRDTTPPAPVSTGIPPSVPRMENSSAGSLSAIGRPLIEIERAFQRWGSWATLTPPCCTTRASPGRISGAGRPAGGAGASGIRGVATSRPRRTGAAPSGGSSRNRTRSPSAGSTPRNLPVPSATRFTAHTSANSFPSAAA